MGNSTALFYENSDYIMLLIGFLLSVFWTVFFIYKLKPNLEITYAKLEGDKIKTRIQNNGRFRAVNLQIEICKIRQDNKNEITDHYQIDREDYLILPSKRKSEKSENFRDFKTNKLIKKSGDIISANKSDTILRIRLYATHEFSGFGKAFEQRFKQENDIFLKV